jgi:hypothetical protein
MTDSIENTPLAQPTGWSETQVTTQVSNPRPKTGHQNTGCVSLLSGFRWQSAVKELFSPRKTGLSTDGIPVAKGSGMDNNINKASIPFLGLALVIIAAIGAKIRATIDAQAPEGYEDESGFHFGSTDYKH